LRPATTADNMAAPDPGVRIAPSRLAAFVQQLFIAAGCASDEAGRIAENLVQANLYGHDSHGIGLVPAYLRNLRAGIVRAAQEPKVVVDQGALLGLDGQSGFGQTVGAAAMRHAIERAERHGCCVVGLASAHHLARIGRWAEQCAEAGMVSVHFVNVISTPLVAPWGGADARLATNPFCVGVPAAPHPIVLDYATSAIAFGKARVALDEGKPMAEGLLMDAAGRPTCDPAVMFGDPIGALLPFGQHKGFALAVICELLGGALSGGQVQDHRPDPSPMRNNMLSVVFAADRFCSPSAFAEQLAGLRGWLTASPAAPGSEGVQLPGEPERRAAAARAISGIALPARTVEQLDGCARELQVPALFAAAAGSTR
jgi:uncharacterized oxidoreductase